MRRGRVAVSTSYVASPWLVVALLAILPLAIGCDGPVEIESIALDLPSIEDIAGSYELMQMSLRTEAGSQDLIPEGGDAVASIHADSRVSARLTFAGVPDLQAMGTIAVGGSVTFGDGSVILDSLTAVTGHEIEFEYVRQHESLLATLQLPSGRLLLRLRKARPISFQGRSSSLRARSSSGGLDDETA